MLSGPGLSDVPTRLLKAMVALCPKKPGESVTFSGAGMVVKLTSEHRQRGQEELDRRKNAAAGACNPRRKR